MVAAVFIATNADSTFENALFRQNSVPHYFQGKMTLMQSVTQQSTPVNTRVSEVLINMPIRNFNKVRQ